MSKHSDWLSTDKHILTHFASLHYLQHLHQSIFHPIFSFGSLRSNLDEALQWEFDTFHGQFSVTLLHSPHMSQPPSWAFCEEADTQRWGEYDVVSLTLFSPSTFQTGTNCYWLVRGHLVLKGVEECQ